MMLRHDPDGEANERSTLDTRRAVFAAKMEALPADDDEQLVDPADITNQRDNALIVLGCAGLGAMVILVSLLVQWIWGGW